MKLKLPQPATIVACVALLIALSGTSLAAGGGSEAGDAPALRAASAACSPGASRVGRFCFDSSPSGPIAGVKAAADACGVAGGYLPTPAELEAARGELRLGDGRGTHSQFTDSYFPGGRGRAALTTVVDDAGSRSVVDEDLRSGRAHRPLRVHLPLPPGERLRLS